MPKSSIESWTPRTCNSFIVATACSTSCMIRLSVSSSSRYLASRPLSRKRVGDAADPVLFPELPRRNVHANRHRRQARILPGLVLPASFAQHPVADRHDQSRLLGERNEFDRRRHAQRRMHPADQRLDREDAPRAQIDLRLIEQHEFRAGDGVSQFLLQQEFFVNLDVQLGRVELEIVAADFLGAIHRRVGIGQQRVGVRPIIGIVRDADAACHSGNRARRCGSARRSPLGFFARSRR